MSKSPYVSPSLRPTTPWGGQTSTGQFRPPGGAALHSSSHEPSAGDESVPHKSSPSFTVSVGNQKPDQAAPREGDARKPKPSPMLHATAPPFYPSNANSPEHGFLPPPPPFRPTFSGSNLPAPGTHTLDEIVSAVSFMVHREEDQYAAVKESNRVLESEIQRMQMERQMQSQDMDRLDEFIALLTELNHDQARFLEQKNSSTDARPAMS